ncbi:MAG: hypothetical protein ACJAT7_000253 [Psychromonas sp.]|jgi:hypothetical protein
MQRCFFTVHYYTENVILITLICTLFMRFLLILKLTLNLHLELAWVYNRGVAQNALLL